MSIFSRMPVNRPGRNSFNLSHEKKMTLQMGTLTPIFVQDVVPGDYFKLRSEVFIRFLPMFAPIMHRVNVYTHYFFVPNRLVCADNDWQEFITGGDTGDSDVLPPICDIYGLFTPTNLNYIPVRFHNMDIDPSLMFGKSTLWDYMGLPIVSADSEHFIYRGINVMPFLAYQLIYNYYYRDQNLQPEINLKYKDFPSVGGIDHEKAWREVFSMRRRNWEKDYRTSALPFTQKGAPITIPIAGEVPVEFTKEPGFDNSGFMRGYNNSSGAQLTSPMPLEVSNMLINPPGGPRSAITTTGNQGLPSPLSYDPNGSLTVDLGDASNVTINDLRTAFQLQRWMERNARAGSRYIEQILSHFGIKVPDFRLQMPEYLGGGRNPVRISEVLQTSEGTGSSAQGTMAGHGISASSVHGFKRKFNEHGYVIGIMSVLPRTSYQQFVPKHFMRNNRFDYFWPTLAHLGEQEVKNKEVYYDPHDISDQGKADGTFGYQSRYCEYRYSESTVHGDFQTILLDFWHMGRKFNSPQNLNSQFITADPTNRVFAVDGTDPLLCQVYHDFKAVRPMPRFANPGYVDHF